MRISDVIEQFLAQMMNDGNGEVDIRDLVRMKRYISDADIEIDPAADINIDGDINAEDLSELRIMLLNM